MSPLLSLADIMLSNDELLLPEKLEAFLTSSGYIDDVYTALQDDDLARAPLTVFDILEKTNSSPRYGTLTKSTYLSTRMREMGNLEFKSGRYLEALRLYNYALVNAPKNSTDEIKAYSNRSALLYHANEFNACLQDIDTCFKLGADFIADKLNQRKRNCVRQLLINEDDEVQKPKDIFKLKGIVNSDIPCAPDNEVRIENGVTKVIAKKNIEIGSVVAIETAYVAVLNNFSNGISCYHCHRQSKNLMPCPNCCYALFCNEECQKQCMDDVHRTECYFTRYNEDDTKVKARLVFKAFLKLKQHSASWSDLIELSNNAGNVKRKSSSNKDLYNTNDKFAILNFKEKSKPRHGPMFNFSYIAALYIQFLLSEPNFFPANPEERKAAMAAAARLMMKLYLHLDPREVRNAFKGINTTHEMMAPNHALFTFIGQLNHKCEANLVTVSLGNKLALVAIKNIANGNELTISHVEHAYDVIGKHCNADDFQKMLRKPNKYRSIALYRTLGLSCNCHICKGTTRVQRPSRKQMKQLEEWVITISILEGVGNVSPNEKLKITLKTMKALSNVPFSEEFASVYAVLFKCFQLCQSVHTGSFLPVFEM